MHRPHDDNNGDEVTSKSPRRRRRGRGRLIREAIAAFDGLLMAIPEGRELPFTSDEFAFLLWKVGIQPDRSPEACALAERLRNRFSFREEQTHEMRRPDVLFGLLLASALRAMPLFPFSSSWRGFAALANVVGSRGREVDLSTSIETLRVSPHELVEMGYGYITIQAAADMIGIPRRKVLRLHAEGKLELHEVKPATPFVASASLREYLKKRAPQGKPRFGK